MFFVNMDAQIKMDIKELTMNNIKKPTGTKISIIGSDTIIRHTEVTFETPIIDALIRVTNLSDSTVVIYPKNSTLSISYKFNGNLYNSKLNFTIQKSENILIMPDSISIHKGQDIGLYAGGLIAEMGSLLSHKLHNINNFTLFLLEISPTLRFHFEDRTAKIKIDDFDIQKVIINMGNE